MRSRWRGGVALAAMLFAGGALEAQTDGTLRWTFATGGFVLSSPAVAPDGTVYVGSESRRLFAINPNGSFKWSFYIPHQDFPAIPTNDWFDAAPTIGADGTIYAGNFDGKLYAINPNGTAKWSYDTFSYILSSVAIGPDGTLYFGAGDGDLYALNPDGTLKWRFSTGDWVDSSPAVGSDGTIYVGSWDKSVYAITPAGTKKWEVITGDAILSSPALGADDTVYVGSGDGNLYAIRADGSLAWTYATGDTIDASPVVGPDGTVYFGSADGKFHAVKPDGTAAWTTPFNVGQGVFGGALLRADGTIIFGASDRKIYALNANGTLKWTYATGDIVDSSPAIATDGTIYVGSYDQKLYAIRGSGSSLANSAWPKFRHDARNEGRVAGAALPTAPDITIDPQSQTVEFGASITLSAEATGTQPFTYQWQKDGVDIAGATASSFTIAQVVTADAGSYRVRITNAAGFDLSAAAVLTVNPPVAPSITRDPRPLVVVSGNRLSLWTIAAGSPPFAYQWFKDGIAVPGATASFYEVAAASAGDAGSYHVQVTNAGGMATSAAAAVAVDPGGSARIINLSSRAFVGTGDSILIPGFVIGGSATRRLLVRAAGPTLGLPPLDVPGVLADPTLTIYSGSNPVFTNDNWGAAPNAAEIATAAAAVFAFPFASDSADAAALVDLAPGLYTVHVSGVGATTGIALVELYDVGAVTAGESRLVNISARADAGVGANVMIPGFTIEGNAAKTLLIRAVGPTLSSPPFNVSGVLADPVLRLYQGQTEILVNDDWTAAPDPAAVAGAAVNVSAFALESGSTDAAMLVVLMPGSYTAHAGGAGETTGNVLVEVYEVQ